uniref:Autophagy-related protein 9 n=1 Tax=Phascolarctos cinereus TaxID=38626 RepID=A0A6P5JJJ9_PHACI|nr:autophagy-related protein 9B isoform X5 [Phascolarctos cinereus]
MAESQCCCHLERTTSVDPQKTTAVFLLKEPALMTSGTPSSASSGLRSYSTPCLASVTPLPSQWSLQNSPGLRMGPLIPEQDYERLEDCDPDRDCDNNQDSPLPGEDQEPLLHVPEGLRGSWHHIQNLDSFFTMLYNYHQRNGFACMFLEDVFQLGQFVFIVTFTTFLLRCVDYDVLFANRPVNHTQPGAPGFHQTPRIFHNKVTLSDAILPAAQCAQRVRSSSFLIFLLLLASGFWLFRLLRSLCNLLNYWDIRTFYREALYIPPEDVSKVPWAEIQSRLLALQRGGGLCVLPRPLTECFIPEEELLGRSPKSLLQAALAHMHYLPEEPGPISETNTYHKMSQLLQYKAVSLLEELLSPVLTPLALLFWFRPRALEFIDFFRHFTVDVAGVGDVCSFALMDVKRHGHPQWLSAGQTEASVSQRAEDGKTELSLMRFSLAHPRWRPPGHSSRFLEQLRGRVQQDAALWAATPVRSPPTPGQGPSFLNDSTTSSPETLLASLLLLPFLPSRELSPVAPCPAAATASLLASISGSTSQAGHDQSCVSPGGPGVRNPALLSELASAEMSLHAIYLHELHQQQQQEQWGETSATPLPRIWPSPQRPLTPEDETLIWHSDGTSSSSSSPRQQWGPTGASNLPLGGWQEEGKVQKEPELSPSSG